MKCRVTNGHAEVNDIVSISSYGSKNLYKVTGFQQYNGKDQITYRKVIPSTLEFFPETKGSSMDFDEALTELEIVKKG